MPLCCYRPPPIQSIGIVQNFSLLQKAKIPSFSKIEKLGMTRRCFDHLRHFFSAPKNPLVPPEGTHNCSRLFPHSYFHSPPSLHPFGWKNSISRGIPFFQFPPLFRSLGCFPVFWPSFRSPLTRKSVPWTLRILLIFFNPFWKIRFSTLFRYHFDPFFAPFWSILIRGSNIFGKFLHFPTRVVSALLLNVRTPLPLPDSAESFPWAHVYFENPLNDHIYRQPFQ